MCDSDDVSPYRVSALHLTKILNYCENTKYIVKKTGAETVKSVVGKYEAKIRVSRTRYRKIEVSKKRGGNGLVRLTPR